MYQNQVENEQRAFHIPIADRVDGLIHTSKLNSLHFGLQNDDLKLFFFNMRDEFDNCYKENKKFLGVILYMAGIPKEKHNLKFDDFKTEEIFDIIKAMIHIKAVTATFPKKLALPQ